MNTRVLVDLKDVPTRKEWLEARRRGIGSSDVAGICGLDRYNSPLSVWLDKTEGVDDDAEGEERAEWGRLLEEPIAKKFEQVTGLGTSKPPAIYQHPTLDHMIASPDRFVGEHGSEKVTSILEIKTYTGGGDLWLDGPPDHVVLQVTHQLMVVERSEAWIAVLEHGHAFRHWKINLDPTIATHLERVEAEFWEHVVNREAPPADGHPATTAALAQLYKVVDVGETVDLTSMHQTFIDLAAVKARREELERRQAELENQIKAELGAAETGLYEGVPFVTWKPSARFDAEAFTRDHPSLAARFAKGVSVTALEREHPDLVKKYRREGEGPRKFLFKKKGGRT